jgi:hypothetical protein
MASDKLAPDVEGLIAMFWWALCAFFAWLSLREIYYGFVPRSGFDHPNPSISIPYVLITAAIAAAFAYTPLRYAHFERFLTQKAQLLSESTKAVVHCNTFVDSMLDSNVFAAGHANRETGLIVLQHPWCGDMMDHLQHPEKADPKGIHSVHLFTHETMHIRGEMNEAATDCQAIQRYARAAVLLGIPEAIGKTHGMFYYNGLYKQRGVIGGMAGQYYSDQCAPGRAMDEQLIDSTWK